MKNANDKYIIRIKKWRKGDRKEMMSFIKKHRSLFLKLIDIIVIIFAYICVEIFKTETMEIFTSADINIFVNTIVVAIIVYQIFLMLFDAYKNIIRYENGKDYLVYGFTCMVSCVIVSMVGSIFDIKMMGPRSNLLAGILVAVMIITYRLVIRLLQTDNIVYNARIVNARNQKNLLIIGGGAATRDIIKIIKSDMQANYNLVGIVDDDIDKINYAISGVRILGDRKKIKEICRMYKVDVIFFSISNIPNADKKEILDICQDTGAKLRILPSTSDIIQDKNIMQNLRDVEIDDLLGRDAIVLDNQNINTLVRNRVILVTGGGGSIGSELCRQIMKYNPKQLIILDIYENGLYDIELELKSKYPGRKIEPVIASVREADRLEEVFRDFKPEVVFHAAAHKHVPLMELNPLEAIKNNVFGTYNLANCADKYGVKRFVLISTDKAVNPTNVMGATKRVCEMIIQAKNKVSQTEFMAVRFGNVLGSNGSVIPLFKKQIANGGPVTVTHKDITRFFMTIPEAVQLILQAVTYAQGGEIFVLDMGEPVKIYDLAISLIKLSGLEPNVDIQIEITGLRPGEKLYEELLMAEEDLTATKHNKIFVSKPMHLEIQELEEKLSNLRTLEYDSEYSRGKIRDAMKDAVPTYKDPGEVNGEIEEK